MKKCYITLLVIFGLSCSDLNRVPSQYLQPKEMEQLLWDMMLADRYVELLKNDTTINAEEERFKLYAQVFSANNVEFDEFKESMNYYLSRPDQLKQVYLQIKATRDEIARLEQIKAAEIEETKLKEKDSLLNIQEKVDSLSQMIDSTQIKDSLINSADSLKVDTSIVNKADSILNNIKNDTAKGRPSMRRSPLINPKSITPKQ